MERGEKASGHLALGTRQWALGNGEGIRASGTWQWVLGNREGSKGAEQRSRGEAVSRVGGMVRGCAARGGLAAVARAWVGVGGGRAGERAGKRSQPAQRQGRFGRICGAKCVPAQGRAIGGATRARRSAPVRRIRARVCARRCKNGRFAIMRPSLSGIFDDFGFSEGGVGEFSRVFLRFRKVGARDAPEVQRALARGWDRVLAERSQPRIDRLALHRERGKDALIHPPKRFAANESLQRPHAESRLLGRQRGGNVCTPEPSRPLRNSTF